jgi:hypothetical protein
MALIILILLVVGFAAVVKSAHPDPPVAKVAQVAATPDYAPRAQLIALPVRRAELVVPSHR